jgi:predicted nucleic acid-binding protein
VGEKRPRPVVLDTGGLIAYERGDRKVVALLELAEEVHIPAGALAQVWRNPAKQVRLVRLVRAEEVEVDPLDEQAACAAGQLCGATGTADAIDASVVLVARSDGGIVVSSDPGDMKKLDPGVSVVTC